MERQELFDRLETVLFTYKLMHWDKYLIEKLVDEFYKSFNDDYEEEYGLKDDEIDR